MEETHYYPFGLTMAGISSKALKPNYYENRKKYNGIEYNGDLDIDEYEAFYRNLDPQTARWWQIDPKVENGQENISPYASMFDDPVLHSDPLGDEPEGCCKGLWDGFMTGVNWINENVNPLTPMVETVTGKAFNDGKFDIDKPRLQSASEAAISLIPGGKIEGAVAKTLEKAVVKQEVKQAENVVTKAAEKNLTNAEKRAAKLSEVDRSGKDFTKAGKDAVKDLSRERNGGQMKCEGCGQPVKNAERHTRGTTPPSNEAHVDHIEPKVKGGSGIPANGQVLCRECNLQKGGN